MADRVMPGPVDETTCIREAVCVHTSKIFDSCRDKDCVEDLRVYPTVGSQVHIDNAFSVRPKSAELLYVDISVSEISFNRGFYTVDAKFFYKITGTVFPSGQDVCGLSVFDKRVILFGSEGNAKIFSSDESCPAMDGRRPVATVEAVDPLALGMKLLDPTCCPCGDAELREIPQRIALAFDEELVLSDNIRRLYVTLCQFSIIRLERDAQLVMPVYDYCFPTKECVGGSDDDPCTLFGKVRFPVEEFFPPDSVQQAEEYRDLL